MKKNEKRGMIISSIMVIMGVIGLIYVHFIKDYVDTIGMKSLGATYLVAGVALIIYFVRLSKNKEKSEEQEILYDDERLNANKEKSCAITYKIIIWLSLLADYIVTFFLIQFQYLAHYLNIFTMLMIIIYVVVHYFVSKTN